jgi:hypothetical protein
MLLGSRRMHSAAPLTQHSRLKWAAVSRVLKRDGASQRSFARFYLVIVSTVLLYGSDTWVVTAHMQKMLASFHHRCAQHITRRHIRCVDATDEWITPSMDGVLREAGLFPIMHYVCARSKWSIVTLSPPPCDLRQMPCSDPNLTTPTDVLGPNKPPDNRVMGDQIPLGIRLGQSRTIV